MPIFSKKNSPAEKLCLPEPCNTQKAAPGGYLDGRN